MRRVEMTDILMENVIKRSVCYSSEKTIPEENIEIQ